MNDNKATSKAIGLTDLLRENIPWIISEIKKKGILVIAMAGVIYFLNNKIDELETKVQAQAEKIEMYWQEDRQKMIDALNRSADVQEKSNQLNETLLLFLKSQTDFTKKGT